MRKLLFIALIICILVSLTGCGSKPQEVNTAGFKPALDTKKSYKIHADPYDRRWRVFHRQPLHRVLRKQGLRRSGYDK